MKNSIRKILALGAAAVMSVACLCTAVSAEEYNVPVDIVLEADSAVGQRSTVSATYSSGSSYVALRADGSCYFHIVLVDGKKIRANGTYSIQGDVLRASCSSYLIVKNDGSVESGNGSIGVDGQFNKSKTTLTISSIEYYKD